MSATLGLSGPQDHFGCKWLPWGSPVRAPLATPVALPRAFMLIFIPRTRVQLCTIANSCTNSDFTPKDDSPTRSRARRSASVKYKSDQALKRRAIKSLISLCSYQSPLWCFIGVKIFFDYHGSTASPRVQCHL